MNLYVHFEATGGQDPYLTYLEFEIGSMRLTGACIRHDVSLPSPRGHTEQEVARNGVDIGGVIPWLVWASKNTRTVVVYDRDLFLRTMEAEAFRIGKGSFIRPAVEYVDLRSKAKTLCRLDGENNDFRLPSLDEASMLLLHENPNGLDTIKALWVHKEIKQLAEMV